MVNIFMGFDSSVIYLIERVNTFCVVVSFKVFLWYIGYFPSYCFGREVALILIVVTGLSVTEGFGA